jgi:hypothetical protein
MSWLLLCKYNSLHFLTVKPKTYYLPGCPNGWNDDYDVRVTELSHYTWALSVITVSHMCDHRQFTLLIYSLMGKLDHMTSKYLPGQRNVLDYVFHIIAGKWCTLTTDQNTAEKWKFTAVKTSICKIQRKTSILFWHQSNYMKAKSRYNNL